MSAILSADDLNDFITPGVACIKPVEVLPARSEEYEVTQERDTNDIPANISLTDCLACSGCVSSSELMLLSHQNHEEVLKALECPSISRDDLHSNPRQGLANEATSQSTNGSAEPKIFVASVSPQVRASLAATFGCREKEAGWMIDQLLRGPNGLASRTKYGNHFTFVVDTNAMRDVALELGMEEVLGTALENAPYSVKKPVLTSACPGWVCYAEKTHPHVLPHLSKVKSPQALSGTLLKSVLSKCYGITPEQIFVLAIMPCFDKKLEASRKELTDISWSDSPILETANTPSRDTDCVITAREIISLADSCGISFPRLPRKPLKADAILPFPDSTIAKFLFPFNSPWHNDRNQIADAGTSGGFLYHMLRSQQRLHPGSEIRSQRGRNTDVVEFNVTDGNEVFFRGARYYGFRNIQNLVRRLKKPVGKMAAVARRTGAQSSKNDYELVEVMACPGGCTNGGGQVKVNDLSSLQGRAPNSQKDWLTLVNETYYSVGEEQEEDVDSGIELDEEEEKSAKGEGNVSRFLFHWEKIVGANRDKLVLTDFKQVESDVGKPKQSDTERVAALAVRLGGGW